MKETIVEIYQTQDENVADGVYINGMEVSVQEYQINGFPIGKPTVTLVIAGVDVNCYDQGSNSEELL